MYNHSLHSPTYRLGWSMRGASLSTTRSMPFGSSASALTSSTLILFPTLGNVYVCVCVFVCMHAFMYVCTYTYVRTYVLRPN